MNEDRGRILDEIVAIELRMFMAVLTPGPSACQENPEALKLMRRGSFSVLSTETMESYLGDLQEALRGRPVVAVDVDAATIGEDAVARGLEALDGLPASLLELARKRLAEGDTDDVAALTPAYVALPRGVSRAAEDLGWSPDLR